MVPSEPMPVTVAVPIKCGLCATAAVAVKQAITKRPIVANLKCRICFSWVSIFSKFQQSSLNEDVLELLSSNISAGGLVKAAEQSDCATRLGFSSGCHPSRGTYFYPSKAEKQDTSDDHW